LQVSPACSFLSGEVGEGYSFKSGVDDVLRKGSCEPVCYNPAVYYSLNSEFHNKISSELQCPLLSNTDVQDHIRVHSFTAIALLNSSTYEPSKMTDR
ncbi:uncharacterized, partial [Tachysurus ichikawai]